VEGPLRPSVFFCPPPPAPTKAPPRPIGSTLARWACRWPPTHLTARGVGGQPGLGQHLFGKPLGGRPPDKLRHQGAEARPAIPELLELPGEANFANNGWSRKASHSAHCHFRKPIVNRLGPRGPDFGGRREPGQYACWLRQKPAFVVPARDRTRTSPLAKTSGLLRPCPRRGRPSSRPLPRRALTVLREAEETSAFLERRQGAGPAYRPRLSTRHRPAHLFPYPTLASVSTVPMATPPLPACAIDRTTPHGKRWTLLNDPPRFHEMRPGLFARPPVGTARPAKTRRARIQRGLSTHAGCVIPKRRGGSMYWPICSNSGRRVSFTAREGQVEIPFDNEVAREGGRAWHGIGTPP